jgi:hypothetical protein
VIPHQQNRTHAVMSQRNENKNSLDDFPTPPWATRALIEHVIKKEKILGKTCLEPACGRGYMAESLKEYFLEVVSNDISSYGYGGIEDFTHHKFPENSFDWVITNPPFRLAEDFISLSLNISRVGVAMLVRTVFIESVGRYNRLFSQTPPSYIAQFVERVPMVRGRLDRKASTATGYCWLIWTKKSFINTELLWIPPCRKKLERLSDYPSIEQLSFV